MAESRKSPNPRKPPQQWFAVKGNKEHNLDMGILNLMILTPSERAQAGLPTWLHYHYHGYQAPSAPGEYGTPKYKLVSLSVTHLQTKECFLQPARFTLVNSSLKYIARHKIKVEGHVQDYDVANTGLDAHTMGDVTSTKAETTRRISKVIDKDTIIVSSDPAVHLHSLKLVCFKVIDVRHLFKRDLLLGLKTDMKSLVSRYLSPSSSQQPDAIQAMQLTLIFFANFAWKKNLETQQNLPLFPITVQDGPISKHTSKQGLIDEVHKFLMWKYRSRLIRPPTPVLIGPQVIRVHVKKWNQLLKIPKYLDGLGAHIRAKEKKAMILDKPSEVREHLASSGSLEPNTSEGSSANENLLGQPNEDAIQDDFRLISLPISMKTKSQKKGFFVYLLFDTILRAQIAVKYFMEGLCAGESDGTHYKCEQAVPRQVAKPSSKGTVPNANPRYNVLPNAAPIQASI